MTPVGHNSKLKVGGNGAFERRAFVTESVSLVSWWSRNAACTCDAGDVDTFSDWDALVSGCWTSVCASEKKSQTRKDVL